MTSTVTQLDLSNCEREPIHISGAVQPHGILIALEPVKLSVVQASENAFRILGLAPSEVLGGSIDLLIGFENAAVIRAALQSAPIEDANPLALTIATADGELHTDAVLHRSGDSIVLEIEPVREPRLSPQAFHRVIRECVDAFGDVRSVRDVCAAAVDRIAKVTGFDRVMVYRFDEEWHGEVIAERVAPGMEPFLGLHYPASDIPAQARKIFTSNWLRSIPDVDYVPVCIVPECGRDGQPLDLSRSALRSVSPLHIEYLHNMGVAASLTISLLKNGVLWGLITCHHRTPKLVPNQLRFACETVGRIMSFNLGTLEESADAVYRIQLKTRQLQLLEAMSKATDIWNALTSSAPDLLALAGSDGVAIRFGDDCRLIGATPTLAEVVAITDWLAANEADDLFVTDSLPTVEPSFTPLAPVACGMMALALSRAKRSYILWFRPETLREVRWGGDPRKPAAVDGSRIEPRRSFAAWAEIVRLHSRPWLDGEVEAARQWRRCMATLIVERAEDLERSNRELALANLELDSFVHIASHDLKEPLRGIQNFAGFLSEDYGSVVGPDGREKLDTLVRLSRRMEALIDSLLALSSVGRAEFGGRPTDLRAVVDDLLETYGRRLAERQATVAIVTPLPRVAVDSAQLGQVFSNLLSNALKYSDRPPRIEIGVDTAHAPPPQIEHNGLARRAKEDFITMFMRDNGIGIREKHLTAIFAMFKRLHAADMYGGGTGAGLAIAKKIVERHHGLMWAESGLGKGTTFYFTLPKGR